MQRFWYVKNVLDIWCWFNVQLSKAAIEVLMHYNFCYNSCLPKA